MCDYCNLKVNDKSKFLYMDEDKLVDINRNDSILFIESDLFNCTVKIDINYCPMCGDRLIESEANND